MSDTERPSAQGSGLLDSIKLLMEAPREVVDDLAEKCEWVDFAENDIVIDVNDSTTSVYFVVAGRLRAMDFMSDDQEVALAEFGPGETFGELSAIDLKARSARVIALEGGCVAKLSSKDFRQLLLQCPGIALALLKQFADFIRTLNTRVTRMSTMTSHQRIYFELLRLAEPDTSDPRSWIIRNSPHHAELASWVGAEKTIVAEAIGNLARDGVIARKHKDLIIKDHARLKRLAET